MESILDIAQQVNSYIVWAYMLTVIFGGVFWQWFGVRERLNTKPIKVWFIRINFQVFLMLFAIASAALLWVAGNHSEFEKYLITFFVSVGCYSFFIKRLGLQDMMRVDMSALTVTVKPPEPPQPPDP